MKTAAEHEWSKFLRFYTKMFAGQPTRLGILENANGTTIDYWLEDGLSFVGIDMDPDGQRPSIEITVGDLTHTIRDARKLTAYFSSDETENGLDIADANGKTTILRFEAAARVNLDGNVVKPLAATRASFADGTKEASNES